MLKNICLFLKTTFSRLAQPSADDATWPPLSCNTPCMNGLISGRYHFRLFKLSLVAHRFVVKWLL